MRLKTYREKRSAERTPEPFGSASTVGQSGGTSFVIQKHSAWRVHYDFRLELEGVAQPWWRIKGPSLNPKDKRLAVMVEGHRVEYGDFEGVIPTGSYGPGVVLLWIRQGPTQPGPCATASLTRAQRIRGARSVDPGADTLRRGCWQNARR